MIRFPLLRKVHANEQGMALITALLILVALTLLGVTAMTNTTIDTMISGNERRFQQKFYAVEGMEELTLAALPDLISGNIDALILAYNIKDVNDLLAFDGDGDKNPDGIINAVLNTYLNLLPPQDFFSAYCKAPSSKDPLSYSVRIQDDDDGDNNLQKDSNNQVFLIASQTDPGAVPPTTDLISYQLRRLLINHDGAVNLIDKDGGVSITMDPLAVVKGGVDKEGIVTTDMLSNFSSISSAQVQPNGVVQGFEQLINPGIQDLHDVMALLTKKTPLNKEGNSITLDKADVKGNFPEIIYVKGDVVIRESLYNKMLIIEDYHSHIGLTLNPGIVFDGLMMLLPAHNIGPTVSVTLEAGSEINGALIVSSIADPQNPQSGPGIALTLNGGAEITYDSSKIVSTGWERRFAVLQRQYLAH